MADVIPLARHPRYRDHAPRPAVIAPAPADYLAGQLAALTARVARLEGRLDGQRDLDDAGEYPSERGAS
jgi:hypothetical protein